MDRGIAGYVATTGESLNIPDAYNDSRFNRTVDQRTGYNTRNLLCMPIFIRGSVIGVVQMVNKTSGSFTKKDEEDFATFAIYCGLALHHAKLYDKIRRSEQKHKLALEILSYHNTCSEQEIDSIKAITTPLDSEQLQQ
ncbi:probable 3',5'-cyclic phosphodiesterase pde-5 [Caerostris darwini]|uniref:Probable 3',5'-cyclic phosphodiesterase pde-5 n=1 Tax=Caerostris darwini TaxID=1538125 RepID=A0AAV4VX80_9ARAC|nr:probable 3',5'-cyclic phosphodiesterase pde-5 [Caerostris darwini]